jgi:hypothetical protein
MCSVEISSDVLKRIGRKKNEKREKKAKTSKEEGERCRVLLEVYLEPGTGCNEFNDAINPALAFEARE